jgi:hypothetical protein
VERFAEEMDTLLEITLRSNLVEKLSMALYDCLFEEEDGEGGGSSNNESKVRCLAVSVTACVVVWRCCCVRVGFGVFFAFARCEGGALVWLQSVPPKYTQCPALFLALTASVSECSYRAMFM